MMKLLGIVGSMRRNGSTSLLVKTVLESAKKSNPRMKTKVFQMSNLKIEACHACYEECSKEPYRCVMEDDLQKVFKEMQNSSAVVIGSPLYFKIPSRLTAFMERLVCLSYFCERRGFKRQQPLRGKPCGLVAVCGGDDPRPVLEHLLNFALSLKMKPILMASYPYYGVGGRGKLEEDEDKPLEAAKTMGRLLTTMLAQGTGKKAKGTEEGS